MGCPEGMIQTSQGCVDSLSTSTCPPGMVATSQGCVSEMHSSYRRGGSSRMRRGGVRHAPRKMARGGTSRRFRQGGNTLSSTIPAGCNDSGGFRPGFSCSGPGSDMVTCSYYTSQGHCSFDVHGVDSCEQAQAWGYCSITGGQTDICRKYGKRHPGCSDNSPKFSTYKRGGRTRPRPRPSNGKMRRGGRPMRRGRR